MTRPELVAWLQVKLSEAEKALRAREQMEQSWRTDTNAEWEAAAKLHPDIAKEPPKTKAERLEISAAQGRIAEKCRHDVAMLKALLDLTKEPRP